MFSFGADGTVVRVADTSFTIAGPDHVEAHAAQLATVLGALDALGVRAAEPGSRVRLGAGSRRRAASAWGAGSVVEGDDPRLMDTLYAVTEPPAQGVRRWTPTAIGFLAGRPTGRRARR